MSPYNYLISLVVIAGLIAGDWTTIQGRAAESTTANAVVAPFLDEHTVVVVGFRPGELDAESLRPLLTKMLPAGQHYVARMAARIEALDAALDAADAEETYLVFSLADSFREMPFVVVPDTGKVDSAAIAELLQQWQDRSLQSRKIHDAIVFGDESTLDRLADLEPAPPSHFAAARETAGEATLWAVVMASDDHRRAIEAMQPELPTAVGGGDIRRLTRGIEWMTLEIHTPPHAAVRLTAQAPDAASAASLQQLAKTVLEKLRGYPPLDELWPHFAAHAEGLVPTVAGNTLRLTFDPSDGSLQELVDVMSQPIQQLLVEDARRQAMKDLKMLGLAMHNYYSTYEHLPPASSRDADGDPLLSWRVAILPFIDQRDLYDQFHLDEPWDSEHNRSLIPRMPEAFRSPLSRHLPSDGLANYRVPGGERTLFPPQRAITFREVSDGLSNTLMVVEVDDDHADVWTKPGAYEVDLQQPAKGLGGHFPDVFLAVVGDGAALAIPLSLPEKSLRALFTRDGGEPSDIE